MKVRRIRFVPWFKDADGHHLDWEEVGVYKGVEIRQLDGRRHGDVQFQLRIPLTDPETGQMTDADGDPAVLRIEMVGATMDLHNGRPTVNGFVSEGEIAYEAAYRTGDINKVMEVREAQYDTFVREEWQFIG